MPAKPTRPERRKRAEHREELRARELDVRTACFDWLRLAGLPSAITDAALVEGPDGRRRQQVSTGWPDITASWCGAFVGVETKSLEGALRASQEHTLGELRASGAIVVVPRSLGELVDEFARICPEAERYSSRRRWALWRAIDAYRRGFGAR